MNGLLLAAYIVAFALLACCLAYLAGFKHGRERERLEPVQHGRIHLKDGPIVAGRLGMAPSQAIERLIEASADICAERRAIRMWIEIERTLKGGGFFS